MKLKPRIVAVLGRGALRDLPATGDADMIEVRLDLEEGDPLGALKEVRLATSRPIIATNRMAAEGGGFRGSERERIEMIRRASDYADYVDIELRAPLRDDIMNRVDKPFIVSYHDFDGMLGLDELRSIMEEMKDAGADIAKIAVTPASLKDNLKILEFLLEAGADMPLCMIAMGDIGRHLRAVAPIYGSAMTYGYVSQPTAPGQMSVSELRVALRGLDPTFAMQTM
jgi:3-dehydroquinate dehydratase-1